MNNETNPLREELIKKLNEVKGVHLNYNYTGEARGVESAIRTVNNFFDRLQSQSLPAEQPEKILNEKTMYELLDKDIPSCMSKYGKADGIIETSIDYNEGHRNSWIKGYKAAQSQQPSQPEGKTLEEVKALSVKKYGNDINSFGQQRDGFVEGYTQAMQEYANQPRKESVCLSCKADIAVEFIPKCYCPECGSEWQLLPTHPQK